MVANPGTLRIPEADFVARIDDLLEKANPERTIPWPSLPPPDWARDFHPRRIIDLGAGVGGFTHSLLLRLGQWGCLDRLEAVDLVERDIEILSGGEAALRNELSRKVRSALPARQAAEVKLEIFLESIELKEIGDSSTAVIPVMEPYRNVDLIVASHLTYYFDDGSGCRLLDSLGNRYMSAAGRLWCVIRRRQCPIYQARQEALRQLAFADIKPFDYAEYFESHVLPALPDLSLLAAEDKGYLSDAAFSGREEATHRLMWRQAPSPNQTDFYRQVAVKTSAQATDLFVERHFILGRTRHE